MIARTIIAVASGLLVLLQIAAAGRDQTIDEKSRVLLQKAREFHESWKTLQANTTLTMDFSGQKRTISGRTRLRSLPNAAPKWVATWR
jgi:hypothetical protein